MSVGEPAETKAIDVSAGLVFHDGKLLITQRPATGHLANLWEFPGGKREPGESFEECLHRELEEELGIKVRDLELIQSVEHTYPEKTVRLKFFSCRLMSGIPSPIECQDLKWVARGELTSFPFPAADAQLLDVLQSDDSLWQSA